MEPYIDIIKKNITRGGQRKKERIEYREKAKRGWVIAWSKPENAKKKEASALYREYFTATPSTTVAAFFFYCYAPTSFPILGIILNYYIARTGRCYYRRMQSNDHHERNTLARSTQKRVRETLLRNLEIDNYESVVRFFRSCESYRIRSNHECQECYVSLESGPEQFEKRTKFPNRIPRFEIRRHRLEEISTFGIFLKSVPDGTSRGSGEVWRASNFTVET